MKRTHLLFVALMAALLGSCGVGVHSVSSGNAGDCAIYFVAPTSYDINVTIDGTQHAVQTIKQKQYKSRRDIKRRANEQIHITPGKHSVKVVQEGKEVYTKDIYVSASETIVIEL